MAQILAVITVLTECQALSGRVKIYAQGAITRSTFSEIGVLAGRLGKKRFNELELTPEGSRLCLGGSRVHIKSLESTLSISPTCALWFPTRDWRTDGDRASDNRYSTAKSSEKAIEFHHIRTKPSVFGLLVAVTTRLTQDVLLDECVDLLAKRLPPSLDGLQLFGCCDVVEPIFIPQLKSSVVMPQIFQVMMKVKPLAYPDLGNRFEALHPLMFGSKKLCVGISEALGKEAKLTTAIHARDFAVVRLAPKCDVESARSRAADWLINGTDKLT